MCSKCQSSDFTTLSAHQTEALRAWWAGKPYNAENLAEAFVRIGLVSQRSVSEPPVTCEGYYAAHRGVVLG